MTMHLKILVQGRRVLEIVAISPPLVGRGIRRNSILCN
jgi:hypothetical protein